MTKRHNCTYGNSQEVNKIESFADKIVSKEGVINKKKTAKNMLISTFIECNFIKVNAIILL